MATAALLVVQVNHCLAPVAHHNISVGYNYITQIADIALILSGSILLIGGSIESNKLIVLVVEYAPAHAAALNGLAEAVEAIPVAQQHCIGTNIILATAAHGEFRTHLAQLLGHDTAGL